MYTHEYLHMYIYIYLYAFSLFSLESLQTLGKASDLCGLSARNFYVVVRVLIHASEKPGETREGNSS